jgi:hypothetical protein
MIIVSARSYKELQLPLRAHGSSPARDRRENALVKKNKEAFGLLLPSTVLAGKLAIFY